MLNGVNIKNLKRGITNVIVEHKTCYFLFEFHFKLCQRHGGLERCEAGGEAIVGIRGIRVCTVSGVKVGRGKKDKVKTKMRM